MNTDGESYNIKVKGDYTVIDDRSFKDVIFNNRPCLDNFWKIHLSPKIID